MSTLSRECFFVVHFIFCGTAEHLYVKLWLEAAYRSYL